MCVGFLKMEEKDPVLACIAFSGLPCRTNAGERAAVPAVVRYNFGHRDFRCDISKLGTAEYFQPRDMSFVD